MTNLICKPSSPYGVLTCPYGRKCCGDGMADHKRKRRTIKRRERAEWKREATLPDDNGYDE